MKLPLVLGMLAEAQTEGELAAAARMAARLTEPTDKDIARWSYAYAREQIRQQEGRRDA